VPDPQEASFMDNQINESRRKINMLRAEMALVEASMRAEITRDQDCSASAMRLLALRSEIADLARLRTRLGDTTPIGAPDLRKPRFAKG
jgi:hypothetical protein